MNNTYNEIIAHINLFAEHHLDVFRFETDSEDQISEVTSKDEKFPMLFVAPISNGFNYIMNGYSLRVYCYDRNMKDRSNVSNIRSKTNQILTDLDTWLRKEADMPFDLEEASTAYPFSDELMTDVTGWYIDFVFDSPASSICDIPFDVKPALPLGVCGAPNIYPEPTCKYQLIYVEYANGSTTVNVPIDGLVNGTVFGMDVGDLTNVVIYKDGVVQPTFPFDVAIGEEISFTYDTIDHRGVIVLDFKGTFINPYQPPIITMRNIVGTDDYTTTFQVLGDMSFNDIGLQQAMDYDIVAGELKGAFYPDVRFNWDFEIDADSAGTYTSIFNGGGLGILRLLKNRERIESMPVTLQVGDKISASRSSVTSSGLFKLVK